MLATTESRKSWSSHLLKNDSLGVRGASEGVGLPAGAQVGLLVVQIRPSLDAAVLDVLAGGPDTSGLTHDDVFLSKSFHPLPFETKTDRKRKLERKTTTKLSTRR